MTRDPMRIDPRLFGGAGPTVSAVRPDTRAPMWAHVLVGRRRVARAPLTAIGRLGLTVGAAWTPRLEADVALATETLRAKLRAVRLLAVRARTRAELLERLRRAGFGGVAAGAAIDELEAARVVDDAALARDVAARALDGGQGEEGARHRVESRGIDEEGAAGAVAHAAAETGEDEQQRADRVADELAARIAPGLDAAARYRRVMGGLARRGFGEDVAESAARRTSGAPPEMGDG